MLLVVVVEWKAWKARWLRPMPCLPSRSKPFRAPVLLQLRKLEVVGVGVCSSEDGRLGIDLRLASKPR